MPRRSCEPRPAPPRSGQPGCPGGRPSPAEKGNDARTVQAPKARGGPPARRRGWAAYGLVSTLDESAREDGALLPFPVPGDKSGAPRHRGRLPAEGENPLEDMGRNSVDQPGHRARGSEREAGSITPPSLRGPPHHDLLPGELLRGSCHPVKRGAPVKRRILRAEEG